MPPAQRRFQGTEPLDGRVAAVFLVLGLILLAPSIPGVFEPTDRQVVASDLDALRSSARQVLVTIDARGNETEAYFRTAIEDVGDRVATVHAELVHRDVSPDARTLRDVAADLANDLASVTDDLASAFGNDAAIVQARAAIDALRAKLEAAGS